MFDHVFDQCGARGLVAGDTQAVDSAPVKANASLEAVREKQVTGVRGPRLGEAPDEAAIPAASVITAPAHQLRQLATEQRRRQGAQTGALGTHHERARLLSNKKHYSPTDPEARISVKPGKVQALKYPLPPGR